MDSHDYAQALMDTARTSECSVCAWGMTVARRKDETGVYQDVIVCPLDASHQGYRRLRSLSQLAKEGHYIPWVSEHVEKKKEKEMDERLGDNPKTKELTLYGSDRQMMTAEAARSIIGHLWPKAGAQAVEEALLLSVQYNLNPLNKEVFIVPFEGKGGLKEVVVLGIEATRKMARRRTAYSYRDGPRALTGQEMEDMGEDISRSIGVICVLETPGGGRFPGYGFWSRSQPVYGADKGNTRFNMASYRAERNALKRIMPDSELPAPVEMVIDGVYADVSDILPPSEVAPPARARTRVAPSEAKRPPIDTTAGAPASSPAVADNPYADLPPDIRDLLELRDAIGLKPDAFAREAYETIKVSDIHRMTVAQRETFKHHLADKLAEKEAGHELSEG